jgi:hypothetical protein
MMAVAASKAASNPKPVERRACKPRASCLKPKEIQLTRQRFDLQLILNYLKLQPDRATPTGSIAS